MAYSDVRRSRLLTHSLLVAAAILGAFTLLQWESIPSLEQVKDRYCHSSTAAPANNDEACVDPYRRPGYLWIDNSTGDYDNTRWIPYTSTFLGAADPVAAAYPYNATENGDIWFDEASRPAPEYLDDPLTPTNWLSLALDESRRSTAGGPGEGALSWLHGRVVLVISDSVDRFNIQWFCREFTDRKADDQAHYTDGGRIHVTATCTIPSLNLTLIHWHLAGMVTYNPAWWWDPPSEGQVPFEERYEKLWSETLNMTVGRNGEGPDLIMWQSALWDRNNLGEFSKNHYGGAHPMGTNARHLVWDELVFYAARAKKLLALIRDTFGHDVPMMLRTVTLNRDHFAKDNMLYDLDRLNRAIGEPLGIEPFEFGRLIAGQPALYMDNMHPARGPASWLWATMLLEYLARAVGAGTAGGAHEARAPYFDGWHVCNGVLSQIGSNAYH